MKTPKDPRHLHRTQLVTHLYTFSLSPHQLHPSIKPIIKHLNMIDEYIASAAPEWPIKQMNKIDLAILRLGVYELIFRRSIPHKVVIDEAVELGKTYGSENTPSFINGALGNVLKNKTRQQ